VLWALKLNSFIMSGQVVCRDVRGVV
jgi:hypothetical protein